MPDIPISLFVAPVTPLQQNCTVVWCNATRACAIIDPGGDLDPILHEIGRRGLRLDKIWVTHGHADHAGATAELKRRTGAVISNQARFRPEQVTISGASNTWQRTADSGSVVRFHFCPTCGSTVYWTSESFPGVVVVAIGNFADPDFPAPTIAVWEEMRHDWVSPPQDAKRFEKQG